MARAQCAWRTVAFPLAEMEDWKRGGTGSNWGLVGPGCLCWGSEVSVGSRRPVRRLGQRHWCRASAVAGEEELWLSGWVLEVFKEEPTIFAAKSVLGLRDRSQGCVQHWSGWKGLWQDLGVRGSALGICSLTCLYHGQGIRQWVGPGVQGRVIRPGSRGKRGGEVLED